MKNNGRGRSNYNAKDLAKGKKLYKEKKSNYKKTEKGHKGGNKSEKKAQKKKRNTRKNRPELLEKFNRKQLKLERIAREKELTDFLDHLDENKMTLQELKEIRDKSRRSAKSIFYVNEARFSLGESDSLHEKNPGKNDVYVCKSEKIQRMLSSRGLVTMWCILLELFILLCLWLCS